MLKNYILMAFLFVGTANATIFCNTTTWTTGSLACATTICYGSNYNSGAISTLCIDTAASAINMGDIIALSSNDPVPDELKNLKFVAPDSDEMIEVSKKSALSKIEIREALPRVNEETPK